MRIPTKTFRKQLSQPAADGLLHPPIDLIFFFFIQSMLTCCAFSIAELQGDYIYDYMIRLATVSNRIRSTMKRTDKNGAIFK